MATVAADHAVECVSLHSVAWQASAELLDAAENCATCCRRMAPGRLAQLR